MSLTVRSILLIVLCVLITPLHIYGWVKFRQFKNHFFIQNRFPNELIVVSITTFTLSYITMIRSCLIDDLQVEWDSSKLFTFEAVLLSLCYLSTNIIFYRAHLVHLQCKQHRNNAAIAPKKVAKQCSARGLLIYIAVSTVTLLVICIAANSGTSHTMFLAFWMVTVIIGVIYVIVIKCMTIEEQLGIMIDIVASTIVIIVLSLVHLIPDQHVTVVIQSVCQNLMALLPLWNALLLLRKYEGSLDRQIVMNYEHSYENPDLYSPETDQFPLYKFLEKENNYNMFSAYLCGVFAVENLKFVTNVLILRQCVWRYRAKANFMLNMSKLNQEDTNESANIDNHVLYRLRLEYLENMYKKFEAFFVKDIISNDPIFYDLKDNFFALCQQIYLQFVDENGPEPIKMMPSCRKSLSVLLETELNKDKFNCFDDFLHLFHDSMIEAWNVLEYCYGFHFEKFMLDAARQQKDPEQI